MPEQIEPLEYRLTARNDIPDSQNPIHRDEAARALGYTGGLVAGVTLYAYLCDAAVRVIGPEWLERGYGEARFRRPVYDGEEVTVRAEPREKGDWWIGVTCDGALRMEGMAGPYRETVRTDDLERDDHAAPIIEETVGKGVLVKRPYVYRYERAELEEFLHVAGLEHTALAVALRERGLASPQRIADFPLHVLWRGFLPRAGIHTRSVTEWVAPARIGETFYSWGIIDDVYEKRGLRYIDKRIITVDSGGRTIARQLYVGALVPGG